MGLSISIMVSPIIKFKMAVFTGEPAAIPGCRTLGSAQQQPWATWVTNRKYWCFGSITNVISMILDPVWLEFEDSMIHFKSNDRQVRIEIWWQWIPETRVGLYATAEHPSGPSLRVILLPHAHHLAETITSHLAICAAPCLTGELASNLNPPDSQPSNFPKHMRSTKCGHTGSGSSSSSKIAWGKTSCWGHHRGNRASANMPGWSSR